MNRIIKTAATLIVGIFGAVNVHAQIFHFSTPINGGMSLTMRDTDGSYSGSIYLTFTNLTETVYVNSSNGTVQQMGFVSVSPSASNIVFNESIAVAGTFPNPPTTNSAKVTVNLGLVGGGLSFDTGIHASTWNSSAQAYSIAAIIGNIPVSGSYTLVTGGTTNIGTLSYYYYPYLGNADTYSLLTTTEYPNSISLTGMGTDGGMFCEAISSGVVANVTATNGVNMVLSPGSYMWGLVYAESFTWSSSQVTATNIAMSITSQPRSTTNGLNSSTLFTVASTNIFPSTYMCQWYFNNNPISNATNNTLSITNIQYVNAGNYYAILSYMNSSISSSVASLTIVGPPIITSPFTGATPTWGTNVTLSVGAAGWPVNYQWYFNGQPITGATNSQLNFPSIQIANSGAYYVVVSNQYGSVTNAVEQVVINPAPVTTTLGFSPALTITGEVGASYIIQSITNLTSSNWITLTNLTLTQPIQIFVDTSVNASSSMNKGNYYRLVQQ
jgi:hypothetical protein